jgi:hypothetical protein
MVVAVIGLTILLVLTMTLLSITLNMNGNARRRTREVQALAAAEAACSRGVSMLEQGMIAAVPYQQTNIALGRRSMDLRVVGLDAGTSGPYAIDRYEVRGTGHAGTVSCAVALGGRHDSFLRYSRFLGSAGVSYGAGASLTGQLYAGGNLDMAGSPVTFEEDVSLTGVVNNRTRGVFHRNVYEHAAPISLGASMDVATYRGLAQQHGMYYTAQATPPVIDFSLFDFTGSQPKYNGVGLGTGFNGIVFCEGDIAVKGVLEGRSVTVVAGSDVIISDNVRTGCSKSTFASATPLSFSAASGAESVQTVDLTGLMSGVSNSLKLKVSGQKWQRLNVYLKADGNTIGVGTVERPSGTTANLDSTTILAGRNLDPAAHQYTAEVHYWSTGVGAQTAQLEVAAGTPVNIGLLAKDYVYISQYAPRVLTVDAALFARDYNWRPIDESDTSDTDNSHPKCHGVWDLDQDGQIEANNQDGWDERNVGNSTWMLNINGPIITRNGGSAGAWEYQGSSQGKGTRHYNYDNDIVYYEPPDFPVILSRWAVLYWRRV